MAILAKELGISPEYAEQLNSRIKDMVKNGANDDILIFNALLQKERLNPAFKEAYEKNDETGRRQFIEALHKNIKRMIITGKILFEENPMITDEAINEAMS